MGDPVLHLLVGPNGAGKSTLYDRVIAPVTRLPFVNADLLAAQRWPDDAEARSYDAARLAAGQREDLVARRESFATETVFSHRSKLELLDLAVRSGYLVTLHVVLVPEELAVGRVANRVTNGGHPVPEAKVRQRYHRLWPLVVEAVSKTRAATIYDNSTARRPFQPVAIFADGRPVGRPTWPTWCPDALRDQW